MKLNITVLLLMLLNLAIIGCTSSSLITGGQVVLEAKLADVLITEGVAVDTVTTVKLTNQEIDRIGEALEVYAVFREEWSAMDEDPTRLVEQLLTLSHDYGELKAEYTVVKQIVTSHWEEYSPSAQTLLRSYGTRATEIDRLVNQLLLDHQPNEAVQSALEMGFLIARVASL